MNQTFDLNRFAALFKKHTVENYKTYLMSIAVLAGILLLFMGFAAYVSGGFLSQGAQAGFFISFLLISGSIFTSIIFADLGDKKKAISALTLPASHFEKYLVNWLYSFVIFQLLFVAVFYLMVMIVTSFSHPNIPGSKNIYLDLFAQDKEIYVVFFIYTFLHATAFLGAIYFDKLHFIKTAFAFFIGAFLLALLNKPIMALMIDQKIPGATLFSPIGFTEGKNKWEIKPDINNLTAGVILGLIVLILWISAYYKLKEKEV